MKNKRYLGKIILIECMVLSLQMRMSIPSSDVTNGFYEVLYNIKSSMTYTWFLSALLFALLFYADLKIDSIKSRTFSLLPVVSVGIALIWLMGSSYSLDGTLQAVYKTSGQIVKSVIYIVGTAYLLNQGGYLFYHILKSSHVTENFFINKKIGYLTEKHPFAVPFFILLIAASFQLAVSYPADLPSDTLTQLHQFFGNLDFNTHHPAAHTVLVGNAVKLGIFIGNSNVGLFLIILIQALCFSSVFAYVVYTMSVWKTPAWLRILTLFAACFSPYYISYVGVALKDVLYSYAILLFEIELIYMFENKVKFFNDKRHVVLFMISSSMSILMRNNGKYIIYPVTLILLILALKRFFSDRLRSFVVLSVPIIMAEVLNAALIFNYNITDHSIVDALSLPLQQTARYVKYNGEDVTEEEQIIISKVLEYDKLAESYRPLISDNIKYLWNKDAAREEIVAYFKVWFLQFFRHPMTYIGATVNQNYFLLYPKIENIAIYSGSEAGVWDWGLHDVEELSTLKELRFEANNILYYLPIAGTLSCVAFYNIIFIYLLIIAIYERRKGFFLIGLPVLLSNLIIVAAPAIRWCPRYAFPIVYSMPIIVAYAYKHWNESTTLDKGCNI